MREHPVPQNVTSYEFHLIGNMTLKQFLELAAGVVVGVIIYSTNLPTIIKWPLIIFFAGIGAMIAFVPFEGRPLDQWFFAFIKAIYRPTQFYWRKMARIPDYFTYVKTTDKKYEPEYDYRPIKQQRIQEFIKTLPGTENLLNDHEERQRANDLISLFDQVQVQEVVVEKQLQKPSMTVEPRNLQPREQVIQDLQHSQTPSSQPLTTQLQEPSSIIFDQNVINNPLPLPPMTENIQPVAPQVLIPEQAIPTIQPTLEQPPVQATPSPSTNIDVFSTTQQQTSLPQSTQQAHTSSTLPFPQKPQTPNTVVGMVFDHTGNILSNAIVEIIDQQGMPARAVKTNAIGQFSISTPLQDGIFYIQVEKAPYQFSPLQLTLQQTYLDPIDIHAVL